MRKGYKRKSARVFDFSHSVHSFRPATFLGELFCYVFNGFEISVNFCGFETLKQHKLSHSYINKNSGWDLDLLVGAFDSQCRSRNCPGFYPSILRRRGIWGSVDEAGLNKVLKKICIFSGIHFTPLPADTYPTGKWCPIASKLMKESGNKGIPKNTLASMSFMFYGPMHASASVPLHAGMPSHQQDSI